MASWGWCDASIVEHIRCRESRLLRAYSKARGTLVGSECCIRCIIDGLELTIGPISKGVGGMEEVRRRIRQGIKRLVIH